MSKLAELLAQQKELDKLIAAAKVAEQADAIKQIVELAKRYGISYTELKLHLTKPRKRRTKVEIAAG